MLVCLSACVLLDAPSAVYACTCVHSDAKANKQPNKQTNDCIKKRHILMSFKAYRFSLPVILRTKNRADPAMMYDYCVCPAWCAFDDYKQCKPQAAYGKSPADPDEKLASKPPVRLYSCCWSEASLLLSYNMRKHLMTCLISTVHIKGHQRTSKDITINAHRRDTI